MSRGKWLKTKAKEAYHLAKKKWAGYFQAKTEYYRKHPEEWVKEQISILLRNVDPLETIAIIGSTIVIHDVILKLDTFLKPVSTVVESLIALPFDFWNIILSGLDPKVVADYAKRLGLAREQILNPNAKDTIFLWLISFGIAYYAMKHGLELLPAAKSFFGIGVE